MIRNHITPIYSATWTFHHPPSERLVHSILSIIDSSTYFVSLDDPDFLRFLPLFIFFRPDNLRLFMKFLVIFVRSLNSLFNCSVGTSFHKIESVQFHSLLSLEIFKSCALCEWPFFHDLVNSLLSNVYRNWERWKSLFFYKIASKR